MKKVDRFLFWFVNNDLTDNITLQSSSYSIAKLFERLINKHYDGKVYKFINLNLSTEQKFKNNPTIPMNSYSDYGGHFNIYYEYPINDLFSKDIKVFNQVLWHKAYSVLKDVCFKNKNEKFLNALELAYQEGLSKDLDTNYKHLCLDFEFQGKVYSSYLFFEFFETKLTVTFKIENLNRQIVYQEELDTFHTSITAFEFAFKKMYLENDIIILKGIKELEYLPKKFDLRKILLSEKSSKQS